MIMDYRFLIEFVWRIIFCHLDYVIKLICFSFIC